MAISMQPSLRPQVRSLHFRKKIWVGGRWKKRREEWKVERRRPRKEGWGKKYQKKKKKRGGGGKAKARQTATSVRLGNHAKWKVCKCKHELWGNNQRPTVGGRCTPAHAHTCIVLSKHGDLEGSPGMWTYDLQVWRPSDQHTTGCEDAHLRVGLCSARAASREHETDNPVNAFTRRNTCPATSRRNRK